MERLRRVVTQIDELLRGELTTPQAARSGRINASLGGMVLAAIACAMLYGACMGAFSLLKTPAPGLDDPWGPYKQVLASTFKVPTLLGLTLLITLPSLYVSNALVGSRLKFVSILQLLVASLAINAVVLASLGPIALFFSVSSSSHPFMQLLNVAFFTIAGLLGLSFLLQTLHRLTAALAEQPVVVEVDENVSTPASNDEHLSALEMPAGDALRKPPAPCSAYGSCCSPWSERS